MAMRIEFKAKVQDVYNADNTLAYRYVSVPELQRKHVDMNAARQHPKYGSYANSDLFPGMLRKIRESLAPRGLIRLDAIPGNVSVDTSGFLARVSWHV